MSTKINYKEKYISDISYILHELNTLQTIVNTFHSVAMEINVNVDTMESLTAIKQSLDLIMDNIDKRIDCF